MCKGETMNQALENKANAIQQLMQSRGLNCQVIEFPQGTRTSADAAACIGCDIAQIAKSLIFRTKYSGKPVLILASGSNRIKEQTIENHVGEKIIRTLCKSPCIKS